MLLTTENDVVIYKRKKYGYNKKLKAKDGTNLISISANWIEEFERTDAEYFVIEIIAGNDKGSTHCFTKEEVQNPYYPGTNKLESSYDDSEPNYVHEYKCNYIEIEDLKSTEKKKKESVKNYSPRNKIIRSDNKDSESTESDIIAFVKDKNITKKDISIIPIEELNTTIIISPTGHMISLPRLPINFNPTKQAF